MKTVVRVAIGTTLTLAAIGILTFTIVTLTTSSGSDRCEYASVPISISVQRDESNLVISWYEPWPNQECGVTYSLQYRIEAGHTTEVTTTGNKHTIYYFSLQPCSILYLQLTAISTVGNVNPGYITRNYTEIPDNAYVTDIEYVDTDQGLLVTWKAPMELITCDVYYSLEYTSEFGRYTIGSDTERVLIPYDKYCFDLLPIFINSWVNNYLSSSKISNYRDNRIVQQVNFSVLPENLEELRVTWNKHFKQELCRLEYHIRYYSANDMEEQSHVVVEPNARFRFVYCIEAALTIRTYGLGWSITGPIDEFEATQYPENITNITDIRIVEEGNGTLIRWDSLISACNVTYNINITTDVDDVTFNITGPPSIILPEDSYCFLIQLQMQTILGEVIGEKATAEFQIVLDPVQDLQLTPSSIPNILIATWSNLPKQEPCNIQYLVTYGDSAHNQSHYVTRNQTTINLGSSFCATIFVQVIAVSGDVRSEETVVMYDREIPSNAHVTDMQFTDTEEGLLVTWEKPTELASCDVHYDLVYRAEFGVSTLETNTESVVIPHDTFCFHIYDMLIGTWVGTYLSSYTFTSYTNIQFVKEVNFAISPEDQEEVIVTWNRHLKQEQCMLEYEIEFYSDELADQAFNVTEPEARFNFIYCADAVLIIRTYGFGRTHRGPALLFNAIQYPENATSIVDLRIEEEDQISVIWTMPSLVPTCTVNYNVSITTDIDSFNYSVSAPPITLPKDSCCFLLRVDIQATVGLLVGEKVTAEFQIGLDPVEDLELTPSSTPNTLIATWTNLPKQELCKIQYLVTYEYDSSGPINSIITTETAATIDLAFCVTISVQVTTVSGDIKSKESMVTYNGGKPILVDPVQDIEVDEPSSNILPVSWTAATSVYYCDVLYTVRANNTEEMATCTGKTGCDIVLNNFCPSTELVITASSLDEDPVDGVANTNTYICW